VGLFYLAAITMSKIVKLLLVLIESTSSMVGSIKNHLFNKDKYSICSFKNCHKLVSVFMNRKAPELHTFFRLKLSVIDQLKAILFHTFPCRQATGRPYSKGGSFQEEGKKNDGKQNTYSHVERTFVTPGNILPHFTTTSVQNHSNEKLLFHCSSILPLIECLNPLNILYCI